MTYTPIHERRPIPFISPSPGILAGARRAFISSLVMTACVLLVSCASGSDSGRRSAQDLRDEGREVFGRDAGGGALEPGRRGGRWTIVLASFGGDSAFERAQAFLIQVQQSTNLRDAYVAERPRGVIVAYGGYDAYDEPRAVRDLERVRTTQMQGRNLFQRSFLSPNSTAIGRGSIPELNLATVRERFGSSARYTLQVGVYESPDAREAARSAEEAAVALRRDGELAFYYHGPTRSMVTIGVFNDGDFNIETGEMSPELLAAQQRHPNNLLNGMGLRETMPGGRTRLQPSQLVQIP